MKISYYPYDGINNKYIDIVITILKEIADVEVLPFKVKDLLKIKSEVWNSDILWLNWFENHYSIPNTFLKFIGLCLLRIKGVKIYFVFHNKTAHDGKFISKFSIRYMLFLSTKIIIHSKVSTRYLPKSQHKKCLYFPHPNYIDHYGKRIETNEVDKTNSLKLLFFGAIKPYKNIDLLIEILNEIRDVELLIAGYYQDLSFKEYLVQQVKYDNIKFKFGFIDDEEIPGLISDSDILIMPYDLTSSLNSGSVILAFSYGRTVICPKIATIEDMESSNFYSYSYTDRESHKKELKKQIQKAIANNKIGRAHV